MTEENNPKCKYCRGAGTVCSYCVGKEFEDLRALAKETTTELVAARAEIARLTERLDAATSFQFGDYDTWPDPCPREPGTWMVEKRRGYYDRNHIHVLGEVVGDGLTREEAIALARKLAAEEKSK